MESSNKELVAMVKRLHAMLDGYMKGTGAHPWEIYKLEREVMECVDRAERN